MLKVRTLPLLTLPYALIACAGQAPPPAAPGPSALAALESRARQDSTDAPALLRLARAYFAVDRLADARPVLERAERLRPRDPQPVFLLGVAADQAGDLPAAQRLYTHALALGPTSPLAPQVRSRLRLLAHRQLLEEVRKAVAQERQLAGTALTPRTIAVFPFAYAGTDPQFEPLGRALAELLTTDLSQSKRLRVLERAQVQALLDELKLDQSGLVEGSTAARSGHLLGAGRLVQGRIGGDTARLQLEAAVVTVSDSARAIHPFGEALAIQRLFDAEGRMALAIYESLGIQPTPAERLAMTRKAPVTAAALLDFGRGLEAEDRGDFNAAARYYAEAARLAPSFGPARAHAAGARELAAAASETPAEAARAAESAASASASVAASSSAVPLTAGLAAAQSGGTVGPLQTTLPDPTARDPLAEALGNDTLLPLAVLRVIFRLP